MCLHLEKVLDPVAEAVNEEAIEAQRNRAEAEDKLMEAVNKRRESELALIDAKRPL